MRRPRVEILYFDGCPNHEAAHARVERVAAELSIEPEIELVRGGGLMATPSGSASSARRRSALMAAMSSPVPRSGMSSSFPAGSTAASAA